VEVDFVFVRCILFLMNFSQSAGWHRRIYLYEK